MERWLAIIALFMSVGMAFAQHSEPRVITMPNSQPYSYKAFAWSPDSRRFIIYQTSYSHSEINDRFDADLYDAESGKLIRQFDGVWFFARFTPDARFIVGCCEEFWDDDTPSGMFVLDASTLDLRYALPQVFAYNASFYTQSNVTSNNQRIAYYEPEFTHLTSVYDLESGELLFRGAGRFVDWSANGEILLTGTSNMLFIRDGITGTILAYFLMTPGYPDFGNPIDWEESFSISPDGKHLIITADHEHQIWAIKPKKIQYTLPVPDSTLNPACEGGYYYTPQWTADNQHLLIQTEGIVSVFDAANGRLLWDWQAPECNIQWTKLSNDGNRLFVMTNVLSVFDVQTGKILVTITPPNEYLVAPVVGLEQCDKAPAYAFSPDDRRIVFAMWNGIAAVYSTETGVHLLDAMHYDALDNACYWSMFAPSFSPDGSKLLTWDDGDAYTYHDEKLLKVFIWYRDYIGLYSSPVGDVVEYLPNNTILYYKGSVATPIQFGRDWLLVETEAGVQGWVSQQFVLPYRDIEPYYKIWEIPED
jgi:WD40 repeat protein